MAKFYGIGTGPGDSTLVTVKAVNTLNKIDILYTPEARRGGDSLALSIVKEYVPDSVRVKPRHFPMRIQTEEKIQAWDRVSNEILEDVKSGKDVGFITLGDPMIYSTYVYVMERIMDEVEVETIPGISSFSNIASNQNFPLVMDTDSLIVVPCTIEDKEIDEILEKHDCIVLMKMYKKLNYIIDRLKAQDLIDHAVLVSNS